VAKAAKGKKKKAAKKK